MTMENISPITAERKESMNLIPNKPQPCPTWELGESSLGVERGRVDSGLSPELLPRLSAPSVDPMMTCQGYRPASQRKKENHRALSSWSHRPLELGFSPAPTLLHTAKRHLPGQLANRRDEYLEEVGLGVRARQNRTDKPMAHTVSPFNCYHSCRVPPGLHSDPSCPISPAHSVFREPPLRQAKSLGTW